MKSVDFYYDFVCPYAYLGHTQIEAVCARAGAELRWRPFLLGGVFKAIGTPEGPAAAMSPAKARLNLLDMRRWADHFGVPLVMPPTHPNRTVLALRAAVAAAEPIGGAPESADAPARAAKALFHAYWALGQDISNPSVVAETLDAAGFDGAALCARAEAPEIKVALRVRTDIAVEAGVFGAPTCVVHAPGAEGELFWGQDRLHLVEKALSGKSGPSAEAAPLERAHSTSPAGAEGAPAWKHLDFFFDFSSPFAYLAATQIEVVAARHGARLRYRPFLLGGLFKAIGAPNVPMFAFPAAKQRHYGLDMVRWADSWGVPFRQASRFPMNTVKPLRMVLALPEDQRGPLIAAIYKAYWALDRDISDEAELAAIAAAAGYDPAPLVAATSDAAIKAQLHTETEAARAAGVCGAPSFLVGRLLFWGQDRLHFVEKALEGWIPPGEEG